MYQEIEKSKTIQDLIDLSNHHEKAGKTLAVFHLELISQFCLGSISAKLAVLRNRFGLHSLISFPQTTHLGSRSGLDAFPRRPPRPQRVNYPNLPCPLVLPQGHRTSYKGSGEKLGSAGAMEWATTWSSAITWPAAITVSQTITTPRSITIQPAIAIQPATEMQQAIAILQAIIMPIEITMRLAGTMKSTIRSNREEEQKRDG